MRRGSWVMLVLALAGPARALEAGWTHDLDLATAAGAGTVTVALSEVSAFGLFGGRLRLGAGPRLLAVPLQDGNDRFRRSGTVGFVAVSFRP